MLKFVSKLNFANFFLPEIKLKVADLYFSQTETIGK